MNGAPQSGFQVPQLGSIGRKMVSFGAIGNKPIAAGPDYFQGDIEDEQEFLEVGMESNVKTEDEEKKTLQGIGGDGS